MNWRKMFSPFRDIISFSQCVVTVINEPTIRASWDDNNAAVTVIDTV